MLFKSNLFVSNISYDIFSVFGPGVCMSEDLMCVCVELFITCWETLYLFLVLFFFTLVFF